MKGEIVGAGLALPKEGRGKQRPYKTQSVFRAIATTPYVARNGRENVMQTSV